MSKYLFREKNMVIPTKVTTISIRKTLKEQIDALKGDKPEMSYSMLIEYLLQKCGYLGKDDGDYNYNKTAKLMGK
jgi:hypothetical protein